MMEYLPDISPVAFAILLLCSFLGSLLSASAGIGGGSFLIAVMASLVPPAALIPLHGLVQLGSNASRAYLTREHTQWRKIAFFALGALLAATLAGLLLGMLDPHYIPPLVGVFILWLSWGKMPDIGLGSHPLGLFFGGLLTTLGTMLVGATGPLVAAWLGRSGTARWQYTANFSASMTIQHTVKVLAFGLAGFVYRDWLVLLVLMILCGYIGTRVGLRLLGKIPEHKFRIAFKWVLTLLALRLIWQWLITTSWFA